MSGSFSDADSSYRSQLILQNIRSVRFSLVPWQVADKPHNRANLYCGSLRLCLFISGCLFSRYVLTTQKLENMYILRQIWASTISVSRNANLTAFTTNFCRYIRTNRIGNRVTCQIDYSRYRWLRTPGGQKDYQVDDHSVFQILKNSTHAAIFTRDDDKLIILARGISKDDKKKRKRSTR